MRVLLPLLALLLAACSPNWYVAPPNKPTAGLRVIAENSRSYYVWTRDTTAVCSRDSPNFPVIGAGSKPDAQRAGVIGFSEHRGDRFERRIQADVPMRLGVSGTADGVGEISTCNMLVGFTPRADTSYELHYDLSFGACRIGLFELSEADGAVRRTPREVKVEPWRSGCT